MNQTTLENLISQIIYARNRIVEIQVQTQNLPNITIDLLYNLSRVVDNIIHQLEDLLQNSITRLADAEYNERYASNQFEQIIIRRESAIVEVDHTVRQIELDRERIHESILNNYYQREQTE